MLHLGVWTIRLQLLWRRDEELEIWAETAEAQEAERRVEDGNGQTVDGKRGRGE